MGLALVVFWRVAKAKALLACQCMLEAQAEWYPEKSAVEDVL